MYESALFVTKVEKRPGGAWELPGSPTSREIGKANLTADERG
jgi:hypothetical protein